MANTTKKTQPKQRKISVAILEDNATLVKGMKAELEKPDISVNFVSDNAEQFLEELKSHQPEIAIIDLRIWKDFEAGFGAISKGRELSPSTRFIVHTFYDNLEQFHKGINLGIKAFVSKNIYEKPLDEVVRIVHDGGTYYGDLLPEYLDKLNEGPAQLELEKEKTSQKGFSKREAEIMDALDIGKNTKEIADKLVVSENTVKAHTKNIREKLGVKTTIEAIRVYRLRKKGNDPIKQ